MPSETLTFITGLRTLTTAGDADTQAGMAAHMLLVTASMEREYVFCADGEYLVVAQEGTLRFFTKFGIIEIEPGEICVIPRGGVFRVELIDGPARAYVCENYGGSFTLPDRGPVGVNCLTNPRDFLTPVAAYEDDETQSTLYAKWGGELYATEIGHASTVELKPVKLTGTMAFMLETRFPQRVTAYAAGSPALQPDYSACWEGLKKRFDPSKREAW